MLIYNISENIINLKETISEACSELKPGISSIDYFNFIKKDIFNPEEIVKEFDFIITGAFDFRFRIYELELNPENHLKTKINFLGSKFIQNNSIIHKIKFVEDILNNSLYFIIASDQNHVLIYNII